MLTFLNTTVSFENETYPDAWFLEVISTEDMSRKCFILPEGSGYTEMVKLLLENMHYPELIRQIDSGN